MVLPASYLPKFLKRQLHNLDLNHVEKYPLIVIYTAAASFGSIAEWLAPQDSRMKHGHSVNSGRSLRSLFMRYLRYADHAGAPHAHPLSQ